LPMAHQGIHAAGGTVLGSLLMSKESLACLTAACIISNCAKLPSPCHTGRPQPTKGCCKHTTYLPRLHTDALHFKLITTSKICRIHLGRCSFSCKPFLMSSHRRECIHTSSAQCTTPCCNRVLSLCMLQWQSQPSVTHSARMLPRSLTVHGGSNNLSAGRLEVRGNVSQASQTGWHLVQLQSMDLPPPWQTSVHQVPSPSQPSKCC
jgi:hypothetical protein